jgi:hypothetical protein
VNILVNELCSTVVLIAYTLPLEFNFGDKATTADRDWMAEIETQLGYSPDEAILRGLESWTGYEGVGSIVLRQVGATNRARGEENALHLLGNDRLCNEKAGELHGTECPIHLRW